MIDFRRNAILLFLALQWLVSCTTVPVADGNRSPSISSVSATVVSSFDTYAIHRIDVEAVDLDGDPLSYSYQLSSGLAVITNTGVTADVSVPDNLTTAPVTVIVSDDRGGRATRSIDLKSANQAPQIIGFGADKYKFARGGSTWLTMWAYDPDEDTLSYTPAVVSGGNLGSIVETKQDGVFFKVKFTAGTAALGSVQIEVGVDDGRGGQSSSRLTIKVVPALVYAGSWDVSPLQPYAFDFNLGGDIFVTDIGQKVVVLDSSGNQKNSWEATGHQMMALRALSIHPFEPDVYLGNYHQGGVILRRSLTGVSYVSDLTFPGEIPHYFLFLPGEKILVSSENDGLWLGNQIADTWENWGGHGGAPGQFKQARQLSRHPASGNIYVADKSNQRIQVLGPDGTYLYHWMGAEGGFNNPHGVEVEPSHEVVFVGDTENDRIQVYDLAGKLIQTYSSTTLHKPRYIRVGPDGRIYVASYIDNKIHIFEYE